jgi:hypothetical protein
MGRDAYAYIIYGILLPEEIYEPDTDDEQWQVYSNDRDVWGVGFEIIHAWECEGKELDFQELQKEIDTLDPDELKKFNEYIETNIKPRMDKYENEYDPKENYPLEPKILLLADYS